MEPILDSTKTHPDTLPTPAERRLDIAEIRARLETKKGQAYWRSLEELAETPEFEEFLAKEFPRQAAPLENSLDRRGFVKLLGASLALAGLTSCVRPNRGGYYGEQFAPYVKAPDGLIPGEPIFFATAITLGGFAQGVIGESHQGRPTKLEGNPDHPDSLSRTNPYMQANVLTLYDPDRSQSVTSGGAASTYSDFTQVFSTALAGLQGGAGFHILTETVTSPTLARQLAAVLAQFPEAQWHQFDGLHGNAQAGAALAFGEPVATRYDFSQADVILSLGADFLGPRPGQVAYNQAFSDRRRVRSADDTMNRLYVLEGTPTLTGSMADHRLALRPSQIAAAAHAVAGSLGVEGVAAAELPEGLEQAWLDGLTEDLKGAGGRCVVVAGDEQSAPIHVLAHAMNAALGSVGKTVFYTDPVAVQPTDQIASLRALTEAMSGGDVQLLLILGGNPAYTAPADLGFAEALARVPLSAHLSLYQDETSTRATWHVPQTHELETWSDARAFDGTATIIQPLIDPFYDGISPHAVLSSVLGDAEATALDVVQGTYEALAPDFESFWRQTLFQGTVNGTKLGPRSLEFQAGALAEAARTAPTAGAEGLEVAFRLDYSVLDGRYSNNGWLQELPRPFTKLTWDNAALIAPALAEREGLSNGDMVLLNVGARSLELPVWLMPGQADNLVVLHLGYGRENAGHIGNGVGFNVNVLRTTDALWDATGARLSPTGNSYPLVTTQMHHSIYSDDAEKRHIVRSGTLAELKAEPEHPHFVHPVEHPESDLYEDYSYLDNRWGMVIDMNVCTSCNACVVACQSENNIPIVGKEQVAIGREMHWIRIDAYYGGSVDDPTFYNMPMMCQHCEQAPCEPVCPVAATVHDHEGLNVMVYNRCVGTRYCSNNCPYKVRRFNFLQYAELEENSLAMLANPEVTVRSRGVMEKCTYCVQRIRKANITASNERRPIRADEVVTACAAACPTQAIIFGDLNNAESRVIQDKRSPLNYGVLTELNTQPRTTYLAKLTNPHPALAEAQTGAH
jgi:molybdopterin-containing oxidoreductase family iron-sulfur binding subunit